MRYHGCVLASKNFIPFYTFSYENKMNEVANYSQMKEYVINLNNLDAYSNNNLSNLFESIIFKRDDLSDMLKQDIIILFFQTLKRRLNNYLREMNRK